MHATGHGTFGIMNCEELSYFAQHAVEGAGFITTRGFDGIAVHGVTSPKDICPLLLNCLDQPRQMIPDFSGTKSRNQRQTPGFVLGVQLGHQNFEVFSGRGRSTFQSNRVLHSATKFDMGSIRLPGAVADPDHMTRPCQPFARGRIKPRQRLFVFQQKAFVTGVKINRLQAGCPLTVKPCGGHEIQCVAY